MKIKFKIVNLLVLVVTFSSCGKSNAPSSDLNLVNGTVDYKSSPGVIGLYIKRTGHGKQECTGTIVRHDLVLTAAHCILEGVENVVFPFRNLADEGDLTGLESRGLKSSLFVTHPKYQEVDHRNLYSFLKADVAFVIFEKNTFINWAKPLVISEKSPNPGDSVKLIGYGHASISEGLKFGIRRSGTAKVNRILSDFSNAIRIGRTWGSRDADPQEGDSGGPMLNEKGEILGTLTGGWDANHYVNLNDKGIKAFIARVMRDPNPTKSTGQNIDAVNFEDTTGIKQDLTKKNAPKPSVPDEL